jgi:tRNA 2-thiouridine synthesizing protein E
VLREDHGLCGRGEKEVTMSENQADAPVSNLDEDGFLKAMSGWSKAMALVLAERNEIGPLSDDHWKVIEFVKSYYETYGTGPPVVKICKATGLSRAEICKLFPCGVVRGAYRLAGLPRPSGCF